MSFRTARSWSLAASLTLLVAIPAMSATPEPPFHRVELKPAKGAALPYTLEVPQGWEVRQFDNFPGIWIGPADAKPPEDPRMIWVRGSKVSLANPTQIVENIKANDGSHPEWAAPRVEARTVGGANCVLVEMQTGAADKARTSLTLKVPFQTVSIDFIASAPRAEFPKMLPTYEHILLSMQPAGNQPAGKK